MDGDHDTALAALRDPTGRPLVVALGGDGTIRDAADALTGTGVTLAVVPGGTGNVLASALRVGGVDRAIDAIRHGTPRAIDLGLARWSGHGRRGRTSGTSSSPAGWASTPGSWPRPSTSGSAGSGSAPTSAPPCARRRDCARPGSRIRADGATIEITGLVVLVANCGDLIPGRLGARQPLDPSDGLLDLIVVGGRSLLDGLRGAAALLWHVGEQDGTVIRRGVRDVRIEAEPAQPIETDGDPHPPGWLEASVLPGALTVLAPPR